MVFDLMVDIEIDYLRIEYQSNLEFREKGEGKISIGIRKVILSEKMRVDVKVQ